MAHMNFSTANCKNCYKCLRTCPVKAIRFKNEQAEIVEKRCIGCSHCLVICPQNARYIESDLDKVKGAIISKKRIIASIAPSFAGYVEVDYKKFIGALRKLGIEVVTETSIGAERVTHEYKKYIKENKKEIYISTCCPSANYLIQKYYPTLIPYIIPVVTPMTASGKILKDIYGQDSFVVFIGPCTAKKIEADKDKNENIDGVLTYEEVLNWINEEKINLEDIESQEFYNISSNDSRAYPITGGILNAIGETDNTCDFQKISVSGLEECMEVFNALSKGEITNVLLEVSACSGSCIGGPSSIKENNGYFKRLSWVKNYIKSKGESTKRDDYVLKDGINFYCEFEDESLGKVNPHEEYLKAIMKSMGKFSQDDELNCGVCGYDTCKDKAIAVYENMSEPTMCLHYMRNKAEKITNMIFKNSNAIMILLDGELNIKEINPAGEQLFLVKNENIKDKPISMLMQDEDFVYVKETMDSIKAKRVVLFKYNAVLIESIVYLEKEDLILAIMVNVMEEEKKRQALIKVKENTLNAAQEVIEKQMRVAQEIASLLGETTAETKLILTKLKKVVEGEEGEIR